MLSILEQFVFFFLGFIAAIVTIYFNSSKRREKWSKVHLYVARDKINDNLYLWLGKPIRGVDMWTPGNYYSVCLFSDYFFEVSGIKLKDFQNLKWEDEPLEVFVNLDK